MVQNCKKGAIVITFQIVSRMFMLSQYGLWHHVPIGWYRKSMVSTDVTILKTVTGLEDCVSAIRHKNCYFMESVKTCHAL